MIIEYQPATPGPFVTRVTPDGDLQRVDTPQMSHHR